MQRIVLIGSGGAGKSTLAKRLGALLGLPVYHLDALHWKPGWVATPRDEWKAFQADLIQRDRWIIDGNYGSTLDVRLAAADTIIFLDMPRWLCMWGAVKRYFMFRGRSRPDMAEGCPERLDFAFLKWVWEYPVRERGKTLQRLAELASEKRIVHLRRRREVESFTNSLHR